MGVPKRQNDPAKEPAMQILMSAEAYRRVAGEPELTGGLDILTLDADGVVRRAGAPVSDDDIDPDAFWVSLDFYRSGQLPKVFEFISRGRKGAWAQVFVAGLDNPMFRLIMSKGVRLTKSSAQAPAIAEYVMCHALSLLHPIAEARRAQDLHEWKFIGFREIASTRWLLVGFGAIGKEIALRLRPFGTHLTVVRRHLGPEPLATEVRPSSDLPQLLPAADVVVLACALNAETRGMAGPAFFSGMKPGSLLINIGRGALVDEAALREGLDRDQPSTAVLDVFETEPLPADAWFWDHPKVRVTGHASSAGDGVPGRGDRLFLENLRRFRAGEALLNEAHPSEVGL
jgi:phosphoglycerate dehydrogenase-like enzyme